MMERFVSLVLLLALLTSTSVAFKSEDFKVCAALERILWCMV